jgi:hypothetical protein
MRSPASWAEARPRGTLLSNVAAASFRPPSPRRGGRRRSAHPPGQRRRPLVAARPRSRPHAQADRLEPRRHPRQQAMTALANVCIHCGAALAAKRRSARYCGAACRVAASRARHKGGALSATITTNSGSSARAPQHGVSVTPSIPGAPAPGNRAGGPDSGPRSVTIHRSALYWRRDQAGMGWTLHQGRAGPALVAVRPDDRWAGMFRIVSPDGRQSDLLNLARARDSALAVAASLLGEERSAA